MKFWRHNLQGFLLLEAVLALGVFGLLASGALSIIRVQLSAAQSAKTKQSLDAAFQALVAYAYTHERLPRPADSDSGFESDNESLLIGQLPYRTLCLDEKLAKNAQGRLLTYAVEIELTRKASSTEALEALDELEGNEKRTQTYIHPSLQIFDAQGHLVCPVGTPCDDACAFFLVSSLSDEELRKGVSQSGSVVQCFLGSSCHVRWISRNRWMTRVK